MLYKKIKYLIAAIICAGFLNLPNLLSADIRVYLYPRAEKGDSTLLIQDIGGIDCDTAADQIKSIEIDGSLYSDGYLDKKEIISILKSKTDDSVFIYGNAVRIFTKSNLPETDTDNEVRIMPVNMGQKISLRIKKNRVTVEIPGTVVSVNEKNFVTVRLDRKSGSYKLVKCVLVGNGCAEVDI